MLSFREFADTPALAREAGETVQALLQQVLKDKETAVLAVPGGSTARLVLRDLAGRALPWQRLRVTLVDERWIAPSNPNSNEGLARSLLGQRSELSITGLYTGDNPEAAQRRANDHVPEPDVAVLGMGEDGHIASLFANDPANGAQSRFTLVERPDFVRITMTPRALHRIPHIVLVFTGNAKRAAFERAHASGPAEDIPVRHILAQAHVLISA